LETEAVKALTQKDRLVISTGGGILLKEENVILLRENATVIYLRAKKETLAVRLQDDDNRPLLQTKESLDEKLTRLLKERAGVYEAAADVIVDVDAKAPEEIVKEILARIEIK
jgi:shikimate kinase